MDERLRATRACQAFFWLGVIGLIPIVFVIPKGGGPTRNTVVDALWAFSVIVSVGGTLVGLLARRWLLARIEPVELRHAMRPMLYGTIFWLAFVPLVWFVANHL
jgi:hypothetical protein